MKSQTSPIKLALGLMAFLAIATSVYPAIFAFSPSVRRLFTSKSDVLLQSAWYIPIFMVHIGFGTFALLSGSTQFFNKLRVSRPGLHRALGKIYVFTVIPSGVAGLVVAFYATGKWYSAAGFVCLALGWLLSTVIAYRKIREGNVNLHRNWMMRSYAFCFAFVTFRILLGLGAASNIPFDDYYSYFSFLCWVPNLVFIEWRIRKLSL